MPKITTNHAITYTKIHVFRFEVYLKNRGRQRYYFRIVTVSLDKMTSYNNVTMTAILPLALVYSTAIEPALPAEVLICVDTLHS